MASAALLRERPLAARRLVQEATDPLATLIALFALGLPLPVGRVERALPSLGVEGGLRLGLLDRHDSETPAVRAAFDLRPYGDETHTWWVLSDLGETSLGQELPPDHVLGIGGASTTLAAWTPRTPVERALDLGTGCGVQALHLSTHAKTVVATDISRRALGVARFNAALNQVDWQVRGGDLFAPVAGERFDLVVSNPPFVITPRQPGVPAYEYRDGGRAGDTLVGELVRALPDVLAPGGRAHFLANWEITADMPWPARWQQWLAGTGLDAWVVQRAVQDPAEYAELWVRDGGQRPGTPEYDELYGAWLDDFASREVVAIGFGVVCLARPPHGQSPYVDLVDHDGPVAPVMGPAIEAGMRARRWLAEHTDEQVRAVRWRLAPDVTEERFGRPGAADPAIIRVRQGGGLGRAVSVGTALAAYLSVCDGTLTAQAALEAIASLLERDLDGVIGEVTPVLRSLVADGFLLPPVTDVG